MADVRERIKNNLDNAHRQLALITQFQKEEISKLGKERAIYSKLYDEEMAKLDEMEYQSKEREEQQLRVDDLSNKLTLTDEAIAQYQMNLQELKAV